MVREIQAETGIPQTAVHCILSKHLFKNKVAVWSVLHALTDIQKRTCLKIPQEHLKWFRRGEHFLNRIIAFNETWIWDFDSELKYQSNNWKLRISPLLKKFFLLL